MNAKSIYAIAIGTVFFLLFVTLVAPYHVPWPAATTENSPVGIALWEGRTYETVFQGVIILAGVFSILLLVRTGTTGRRPP
jgi:hypothetical protein